MKKIKKSKLFFSFYISLIVTIVGVFMAPPFAISQSVTVAPLATRSAANEDTNTNINTSSSSSSNTITNVNASASVNPSPSPNASANENTINYTKFSELFRTSDISAILPYLDKNTLVIFDIDYTIFRSKTNLGSPEWIAYLVKQGKKAGDSMEESLKKYYPAWMRAQKFSDITLMDNQFTSVLSEVKKRALSYMAITTRQPEAAEVTVWQLNKFGVDFTQSNVSTLPFISPFKHNALFHAGILFVHDLNKKGRVFTEWFRQAIPELTKRRAVKRIIFIDDSLHQLYSMQKAAENLALEFVGFHYVAGTPYKKMFNAQLVEIEKDILMNNVSDSEIRLELENAGSYTKLND